MQYVHDCLFASTANKSLLHYRHSQEMARFTLLVISLCQVILQCTQAFDPMASDNVAVYFGHSTGNSNASLSAVCNSSSVDIVILGFVRGFNSFNAVPTFDLVRGCRTRLSDGSQVMPNCSAFAAQVAACQNMGKKVLLSIGGSTSNTNFDSDTNATQAAQMLWNIFGSSNSTVLARPLGEITLDGFDIGKYFGIGNLYSPELNTALSFFLSSSQDDKRE